MIHLIERFGRNIEIKRNNSEVIFVDGYPQEPVGETTLTIKASVQPSTPEDLEMLSEGSDTKEAITLFTIEKLKSRSGNPPKKGDYFTLNNFLYEIISVKDYTSHNAMNIFYYKCIGVKVSYDA